MIGLIRAEALRFVSRRLFRILAVLAVAGILFAAVMAFLQSSKDPNSGLAEARREREACQRAQTELRAEPGPKVIDQCPSLEEFRAAYDKRFVYAETMPDSTRGVAAALFVLSVVVGASFVGADWGSGAITTLLTWEPRRGRVLAAKVLVSAAALALAAAVFLALLDVVFLPVATLRGTTSGLGRSMWWTLSGVWMRGAALAAFGAIVAAAVATIARNTAAVIGVAFAYGVVLDPILGIPRRGAFRPWLLQHNVPRLLGFGDVPQPEPGFPGEVVVAPMFGPGRPLILFAVYGAVILAIAYAAFRSRDVT